jgi:hypothetical protein
MSDKNLSPGSPPGVFTTQEVVDLLEYKSRQALYQSGILDSVRRWEPFGARYPLWDERDVMEWEDYLTFRRRKIAAGEWPVNEPLPDRAPPLGAMEEWEDEMRVLDEIRARRKEEESEDLAAARSGGENERMEEIRFEKFGDFEIPIEDAPINRTSPVKVHDTLGARLSVNLFKDVRDKLISNNYRTIRRRDGTWYIGEINGRAIELRGPVRNRHSMYAGWGWLRFL